MMEEDCPRITRINTDFWERNAVVLREHYGGLLEQIDLIDREEFSHEIKIDTAPTGEPTMSINGLHVHSPRDPAREGQRLAQTAEVNDTHASASPVIILGFGLGYAAEYAAKLGRPVIIVEKYLALLRKAFELRDLTEFLSTKNIIFVAGGNGDGIVNALSIVNDLNKDDDKKFVPSIIRNRALIELDGEWYKNVEEKIRTFSMKDKVNTATLKRFGKRWVRNICRNMTAIRDYPGVERIINLTTNHTNQHEKKNNVFPIFLAAAGPSLDKIKPYLKDIYDRCIIITVDTNFRFFTNNGIPPDFVLTVDPQFWNSRHLDRCNNSEAVNEKTALIIESAVYPPILDLPFKRKFMCGSLFPLSLFIEKQVDTKGRLGAGGSVATTAWDFAKNLTTSNFQFAGTKNTEIWIAGLDLAFPDYKTHFRGARFEETANCESNRFNPAEAWVARALREGVPFKARSSTGGQVLTDSRLSLYAAWFEAQFIQNKNIQNRALFQQGLAINGLHAQDIDELLALPVQRKEIDSYFKDCYAQIDAEFNNAQEARKRGERYDNAVTSLTKGLNSIKKAAAEGDALVRQSLEDLSDGTLSAARRESVTKDLDKITKKIANSDVKEIASFLLPISENEDESSSGTNSDPFRVYLQSSLKLFSSLLESAEFYLGLV